MSKTVTIEIDEMGNAQTDLAGFQGKGCDKVAEEFRGDDVVKESKLKRERSFEEPHGQKERVRQ
jgi:hypothetical protein